MTGAMLEEALPLSISVINNVGSVSAVDQIEMRSSAGCCANLGNNGTEFGHFVGLLPQT